jgi:hypothetical protein
MEAETVEASLPARDLEVSVEPMDVEEQVSPFPVFCSYLRVPRLDLGEVIDLTSEGVVADEDTQTAGKVRQTPSHISYPLLYPLIFTFLVLSIFPLIVPSMALK